MSMNTLSRQPTVLRPQSPYSLREHASSGALAGLVGGIVMMLTSALIVAWQAGDIWLYAKAVASIVLGSTVFIQSGFVLGIVLLGTVLHLLISTVIGATYGVAVGFALQLPTDMGTPALIGMVTGLLLWLTAYFVIAPATSPLLVTVYAPAMIIQHIIFGTVMGMVYGKLRPQPYASMI